MSLYAAFNTQTGEVLGKTAVRHTSAEFVAFFADIVVNQPRGKEIHVIADNLSTHKKALILADITEPGKKRELRQKDLGDFREAMQTKRETIPLPGDQDFKFKTVGRDTLPDLLS